LAERITSSLSLILFLLPKILLSRKGLIHYQKPKLDRFMFEVNLTYPSYQEEWMSLRRQLKNHNAQIDSLFSAAEIIEIQQLIEKCQSQIM